MNNLIKAVLSVMDEVKGIDKTMNVGTGSSSYKGMSDKEVKKIIGTSMKKHGLVIFPIGIEPKTTIERWEESGQYGNKTKQSVFTEVVTTYLLCHESGESVELKGLGNGADSQDKSAGKSTTYALKNTLLYTFLVPTGTIDDADNTHSDEAAVPRKTTKALPELTEESYQKMVEAIKGGQKSIVVSAMSKYKIPQNYLDELNKLLA
jgi:hypothetical protein